MGVGVAVSVIKRLPCRFSLLLFPPLDLDRPVVEGSSVWSYPEHPAFTSRISCIDNGSRAVLLAAREREREREREKAGRGAGGISKIQKNSQSYEFKWSKEIAHSPPRLRPIALLKYPPRKVKFTTPWTHKSPFLWSLTVTCDAFRANSAGASFSSERFICHIVTSIPSSKEWTNPFICDSNLCTSSLKMFKKR